MLADGSPCPTKKTRSSRKDLGGYGHSFQAGFTKQRAEDSQPSAVGRNEAGPAMTVARRRWQFLRLPAAALHIQISSHTSSAPRDLDPVSGSPYGPAACEQPHHEAGHTTAPDHMPNLQKTYCIIRGIHTRLTLRQESKMAWKPVAYQGSFQNTR